ncbi:CopD family protein [Gammaproteobacteria bacterium]|nr:CopD family protein [Gammaproteobacteria bacterium]
MLYLSVKALHIIAMVTWFSGLFYLPRLFVYHAQTKDRIGMERFKVMEGKLFWVITTPGGVVTVLSGLFLLYLMPSWLNQAWMQVKLTFVFLLIIYHVICWRYLTHFLHDANRHSSLFFRWFNELPTIALLVVVVSVVIKY